MEPDQVEAAICADAVEAAKVGDQHRLRFYLDEHGGDVNARDLDTQGTLLHVSCCAAVHAALLSLCAKVVYFRNPWWYMLWQNDQQVKPGYLTASSQVLLLLV